MVVMSEIPVGSVWAWMWMCGWLLSPDLPTRAIGWPSLTDSPTSTATLPWRMAHQQVTVAADVDHHLVSRGVAAVDRSDRQVGVAVDDVGHGSTGRGQHGLVVDVVDSRWLRVGGRRLRVVKPGEGDNPRPQNSRAGVVSVGRLDDGLDLHGEPEWQCGHPDGGPGRPTDAVTEGTDE